jgi:signal peptidase I
MQNTANAQEGTSKTEESKVQYDGLFGGWNKFKSNLKPPVRTTLEVLEFTFTLIILLIVIRQGIFERRYIPSESMLPNLQIQDQLIIEKISKNLHLAGLAPDYQRADIVVFYPPPQANRGIDLKKDFGNTFVRLTGLSSDIQVGPITVFPFFPKAEDAYIKRIVGLPGEKIEIRAKDGVYVNGTKLNEGYILEKPAYSMYTMGDLYNSSILCGTNLDTKYANSKEPIIVPKDHFFCLGDNRNNSNDGHCWGFVKKDRIIGRALSIIWRDLGLKPDLRSPYSE